MLNTCLLSYSGIRVAEGPRSMTGFKHSLRVYWGSTVSTVAAYLEREIMVISSHRIKEISEVQKNYTAV